MKNIKSRNPRCKKCGNKQFDSKYNFTFWDTCGLCTKKEMKKDYDVTNHDCRENGCEKK